ncbi:hypothetical protein J1C56_09110 [Aminobacter anthyllidis]|uniref:Uncharacterized protein n=1 Tax=Aminobacter anthyllidis TaxID=1035067 RepID=A0A9X1A9P3_9HYPH|nr:hypothetical protein [Aminobacter anthyllidis]MBT1155750.1 hypothetical protein [Aminobacter anthyllidis]
MTKSKKVLPSVRVDGGKRINLAEARRRRKRRSETAVGGPVEDTRVSEAWERAEQRERVAHETAPHRRRVAKLKDADGGKDGARLTKVKVKISADRTERQFFRCRPGSFEWRYGRNKQDALFHAGSHLASLWERAGMTIASSANFLRGTRSGYANGIGDGRVAALDKLTGFRDELGSAASAQLIDYCVSGQTAADIAQKYSVQEREMAIILQHHLRLCARYFDFM